MTANDDPGKTGTDADLLESIRAVIRATVSASGEPDPTVLPHLVREHLKGCDTAGVDVEAYIEQVLREMRDG